MQCSVWGPSEEQGLPHGESACTDLAQGKTAVFRDQEMANGICVSGGVIYTEEAGSGHLAWWWGRFVTGWEVSEKMQKRQPPSPPLPHCAPSGSLPPLQTHSPGWLSSDLVQQGPSDSESSLCTV